MKTQQMQNALKKILIFLTIAITEFAVTPTQAQDYKRGSSKTIAAFTFGLGTRSSLIKSDLEYINKMKPTLEGWETSLMLGGNKMKVRTGFGSFKTALSDVNTIKQTSINGLGNIYIPGMTKHFRPYLITGIDVNIFVFSGSYVPKLQLLLTNPVPPCTCMLPPAMPPPPPNPGDSDSDMTALSEEEPAPDSPEINAGKMTSTQLLAGLGSEYNFRINGRFFSIFGEMRYGLPIGVTTQNASMNETKVKNNLALTFGTAIGLGSKRKVHKSSIR
jgi:hypothetical protein